MGIRMVFVMEDGTEINGSRYCGVSDAGGDFRGDAWSDFIDKAKSRGITGEARIKEIALRYEEAPRLNEILRYDEQDSQPGDDE